MTGARIQLDGVSRRFVIGQNEFVPAVDDLTLDISEGTAIALIGPSGSGKSTLLHLIGALDRPDSGTITVNGTDLTTLREGDLTSYRRSLGFVFQRFNLLPALTVLNNVIVPVLPQKTSFDKRMRARELLAAVGMEAREDSLPSRLSGGQQQRVAIARALITEPRLLLADEPTGNLDTHTGQDVMTLLMRLRSERNMTIVVATHDLAVASRCDRVIRLQDGRVTNDDPVVEAGSDTMLTRIRRPTGH